MSKKAAALILSILLIVGALTGCTSAPAVEKTEAAVTAQPEVIEETKQEATSADTAITYKDEVIIGTD